MNAPTRFKFGPGPICRQDKINQRSLRLLATRLGTWFYVAECLFYQRRVLASHLRESLREGRKRLALIQDLTSQLEKLNAAYDQRVAERDALRGPLVKHRASTPRRASKVRA